MLKKIILILSTAALLCLSACEAEQNEVNIKIKSDYSELIKAINESNATLLEKLDAVEKAIKDGTLQTKDALDMVRQAIEAGIL